MRITLGHFSSVFVAVVLCAAPCLSAPDNAAVVSFHLAVQLKKLDRVRAMLDDDPQLANSVVEGDVTRWHPLHYAVDTGKRELVVLLLERGADVTRHESMHDFSPLHLAAQLDRPEIADLLLDNKADLEDLAISPGPQLTKIPNLGQTPLAVAAACGSEKTFDLLLKRGASLEVDRQRAPRSVLHDAVRGTYLWFPNRKVAPGNSYIIEALIAKGAPLESKTALGHSVLHSAIEGLNADSIDHLFMKYGSRLDVNAAGAFGETPLAVAVRAVGGKEVEQRRLRIIKALKAKGARIDLPSGPNTPGQPPLYYALRSGRSDEVCDLLVQ